MLLLLTNRDDLTADWLVIELERRGARFVRFNTEDFPERCGFSWAPQRGASLTIDGRVIALADVHAIWYRRPVAPQPAPGLAGQHAAWAAREAQAALDGAWRTYEGRWVSAPEAIRRADSKPEQLRDAQRLGFEIPDSELTNDPDRLRALRDRSPPGVICKPLRDGYVSDRELFFTSAIAPEMIDRLGGEPYLFQALVPKLYDVRVTIIGEEVFAARIESQTQRHSRVDWRRGRPEELDHAIEHLPDEISELCRRLVARYGLRFGAIDLARRPDGGWTFFELNPNGQWAWIEQRTGLPLRERLADLLLAP